MGPTRSGREFRRITAEVKRCATGPKSRHATARRDLQSGGERPDRLTTACTRQARPSGRPGLAAPGGWRLAPWKFRCQLEGRAQRQPLGFPWALHRLVARQRVTRGVSRMQAEPRGRLRDTGRDHNHSVMTDTPNIKPEARRLVESLPDSASWDDLAYEVYVRQAIQAGVVEADAGRLVEHSDALARVRAHIRRAS